MLGLLLLLGAGTTQLDFRATTVPVKEGEGLLALRDLDGDGTSELLFLREAGFGVRYLQKDGTYGAEQAFTAWPSDHLAWDLGDVDGDGAVELVVLDAGERLIAYRPKGREALAPSAPLLETKSYIPRGISAMSFLRDVDQDGHTDVVLPRSSTFSIRLADGTGGWHEPLEVSFEPRIDHDVGSPRSLSSSFSQRLSVPWFQVEDVDGDGVQDLVAKADDRVAFYLASPDLPHRPTWTLDLVALKDELPTQDGINLDDLMSHAARRVTWKVADLDGQAPADLVVQVGSSFKVYLGGSTTGPRQNADQVLRSSGNVVYFFLRDVEADPLPELQVVRGEEVSLTTLLRWLILPGSLDFDFFTYRNEGGQFSRRPTKRNQVELEIPRLLSFTKRLEGIEDELREKALVPARRVDLFGTGEERDVVDVKDGELLVYRGQAPELDAFDWTALAAGDVDGFLESAMMPHLDELEDGETKTVDIGKVDEWSYSPGFELREAVAKLAPDARFALGSESEETTIVTKDLDGDGRLDLVVVGRDEDDWVVQLVVVRHDAGSAEDE